MPRPSTLRPRGTNVPVMAVFWIASMGLVQVTAVAAASAHSFDRSFAEVRVTDSGIGVIFDIDPDDFDETLRTRFDRDRSGITDLPELEAGAEVIGGIVGAGMVLERRGERCPARVEKSSALPATGMVRVRLAYECTNDDGLLAVRMPLFERMRSGHLLLLVVHLPSGVVSGALTAERSSWEQQPSGLGPTMGRFLLLGVEHILVGYDHMLFLFALLLCARGLGAIVRIVTAFTVAHSLTLVAAGLGWVELPSAVVESAIALTIVVVAVQNLFIVSADDGDDRGRQRWTLTFGLGLVHGFGFASVLGEVGLPPTDRVLPLLAFNVGVEAGQLAVVLAAIPALRALEAPHVSRRAAAAILAGTALAGAALWPLEPLCSGGIWALGVLGVALVPTLGFRWTMVYGGSAAVALLGSVWFVLRALG